MCWSVFGGSHCRGAGPEEAMLKLDLQDGKGSRSKEGTEAEHRRCGNSVCQCSGNSRDSPGSLCLESRGGVE